MFQIVRKIKEQKWPAVFVFSFVLVLGVVGSVLALEIPADSHIYQYKVLEGGKGYELKYIPEFNAVSPTGCAANQCYSEGKCFDLGSCLYGTTENIADKNKVCLLGSWRSSCGNGLVDVFCGEQCEFAGGAGYCDQRFGERDWNKEKSITLKCSNSCTWDTTANKTCCSISKNSCSGTNPCAAGAGTCTLTLPYCQDDCGGYCGDGARQPQFGEQCDTGTGAATYAGGVAPSFYALASNDGGKDVSNQYLCNNKCKATGGFCGDGIVADGKQEGRKDGSGNLISNSAIDFGEKCDWQGYSSSNAGNSSKTNQYSCRVVAGVNKNNDYKICLSGDDFGKKCSTAADCDGSAACAIAPPCYPTGGYCGDGIPQPGKEDCDDGKNGNPADGCTDTCKLTYCGDGAIQQPNGRGNTGGQGREGLGWREYITPTSTVKGFEWCDNGLDNGRHGQCASDCSGKSIGGTCVSNNDCAKDLVCDDNICKGTMGTPNCQSDSDCVGGYYCDAVENKCKLFTAVFLGLHPAKSVADTPGSCTLDSQCSSTGRICSNGQCVLSQLPYNCPNLVPVAGDVLDQCTGLIWQVGDWGESAFGLGCGDPYRKPTLRQLWSLVGHNSSTPPFTDTTSLGMPVSQYVYWTADSADTNNGYAVNFSTGGIDIYPNPTALKWHCVRKPPSCSPTDYRVNGSEECAKDVPVQFGGELNGKSCVSLGFAGEVNGGLACNYDTCKFDKTNCQNYIAEKGKSCQQVCSLVGLSCRSIGTNQQANDGNIWTYSLDGAQVVCKNLPPSESDYCNAVMTEGLYDCEGRKANWTYCNCGGWPAS